MPIFAVNLPDKLFASIRGLIDQGKYHSLESFLEVAAYNQVALERGTNPEELISHNPRTPPTSIDNRHTNRSARATTKRGRGQKKLRKKKIDRPATNNREPPSTAPRVDPIVILTRWALPKREALPEPVATSGLTVGKHVWAQVNRLFPIKLACRWITKAASKGEWPRYLSLTDDLANEAAAIGQVLDQWDEAAERSRDELLATGLPRRGNIASRDRFISQYLARVTRGGDVQPGTICEYALASCKDDIVSLSEEGVQFALLFNPILDGREATTITTLAPEESAFLCRQIRDHAPGEHADMGAVLRAVMNSKTTPKSLVEAIRPSFPSDWTDVVFRTYLSGVIARLADLRLLRRQWEGRNVHYDVGNTAQVDAFLK
jgi:hypothetical protein